MKKLKLQKAKEFRSSSFHGVTISTTPNKLMKLANKLSIRFHDINDGQDKVNYDFDFSTDDESGNTYFTVYDWKEYRVLDDNEVVSFHIGGADTQSCLVGKEQLLMDLETIKTF